MDNELKRYSNRNTDSTGNRPVNFASEYTGRIGKSFADPNYKMERPFSLGNISLHSNSELLYESVRIARKLAVEDGLEPKFAIPCFEKGSRYRILEDSRERWLVLTRTSRVEFEKYITTYFTDTSRLQRIQQVNSHKTYSLKTELLKFMGYILYSGGFVFIAIWSIQKFF